MEGIKFLNPNAHAYLAAIPPQCWSRHAFNANPKSNMLLNNMCETFNSVLREARDKPILTMMEWIRRYVMKRNCQKREGGKAMQGNVMPYVVKYLTHAEKESRGSIITPSRVDEYEVDFMSHTYMVNLRERKCSCYHWELTGLPCSHAVRCILLQRGQPSAYVHEAYTKMRYMMAYESSISPMPGLSDLEDSGLLKPLPPPFRNMHGRPNTRKRRKEADEMCSNQQVKKPRRPKTCSKCGQTGHTRVKCQNPVVPKNDPELRAAGRKLGTSEWTIKQRKKVEKKKGRRAENAAYLEALSKTQVGGNNEFQESQASASHASASGETMRGRRKLGFDNFEG